MQNLVIFYKLILKILSGNKIDGQNDGQPKASIDPFSKQVYYKRLGSGYTSDFNSTYKLNSLTKIFY